MSADLTFGSVPPFYREVYDIVCPNQEHVDQDMFVQILVQSSLPKTTVMQIWEAVDTKQGYLSRNGLYKALALTALAQQGKNINEKLLESFSGLGYVRIYCQCGCHIAQAAELPRPSLGDLSELRSASVRLRREKSPNVLGFTFRDLIELDTIKVELLPEKKGLIIKHVEYEITSLRYKATTLRRYNDFLAFHELLLMRFPYRSIPRLPPKKMMGADREFIEGRRKSLRRYLNLIARHPQMHDDKLVQFFLSFSGSDVQHKIREMFRGIPDEFMTSNLASKAKELVPMDTQTQIANSKEHIKVLYNSLTKLQDITERMVSRATGYASDMLQFSRELSAMSNDNTPVSTWATGANETWSHLKKGFKHLSVEYAALVDKASKEASQEEEKVVEKIALLLDLITAYRDLCDRHEKGVLQDHQRAVQKMGQYKKKKMSATVQSSEVGTVEQLEAKILEQESQIANMENRNYYSLHCLQMETQLIHANLDILYDILTSMAEVQSISHAELCKVWEAIVPIVESIQGESSLTSVKQKRLSASSPTRKSASSPTNNNKIVI